LPKLMEWHIQLQWLQEWHFHPLFHSQTLY
jgi:hypothetical protein